MRVFMEWLTVHTELWESSLTWSMMGEMAAELTGLSVLKVLMWSREVQSKSWEEMQKRLSNKLTANGETRKSNYQKTNHGLWKELVILISFTLAVLSFEALMNIVRSTDVWMSLICFVCSLAFFRISPDCPQTTKSLLSSGCAGGSQI